MMMTPPQHGQVASGMPNEHPLRCAEAKYCPSKNLADDDCEMAPVAVEEVEDHEAQPPARGRPRDRGCRMKQQMRCHHRPERQ